MTVNTELYQNKLNEGLQKADPKAADYPYRVQRAIAAALLLVTAGLPANSRKGRTGYYFSAEYLPGKITEQTVAALGLEQQTEEVLKQNGTGLSVLNALPDPALGNGGLGRLASCIMESAAFCDLPLDGYGIRYRYGIFKQTVQNNRQQESPDFWLNHCPMEICRRERTQTVQLGNETVLAVPYDVPIISKNRVNCLRLWQCEAAEPVDLSAFCRGEYETAFKNTVTALAVTAFLYPDDSTERGKELRLKQQYFFCCAGLGDILADFKKTGEPITALADFVQIQLNDTHPTVAILELLRRLCEDYRLDFKTAFGLCQSIFNYTNHTVMAEALETWSVELFCRVLPQVYPYAVMVNNALAAEVTVKKAYEKLAVIQGGRLYMANLAVYTAKKVNGVAELHSSLIKETIFNGFNQLYPQKFCNITNGVSHRRWLCLANPGLTSFINERIGTEWQSSFEQLGRLHAFTGAGDLKELAQIKQQNKSRLCRYLKQYANITLNEDFIFSVQIKRIHEYKRQLMNVLSVLLLYLKLKNGELPNFYPTAFIFAGKAAPGYHAAKEVIRLINTVAEFLNRDDTVKNLLQIVFMPDYNIKNAMQIIPAANLSEQISMATTEASGTGNMKLSMNGAPTVGTLDGANIEIVRAAGEENNYIFGANATQIKQTLATYSPWDVYHTNPEIREVLALLQNGVLGDFDFLYKTLLGDHDPDRYRTLMDLPSYNEARLQANADYQNTELFATKCLHNIAGSAGFSSDRTVQDYNRLIWQL